MKARSNPPTAAPRHPIAVVAERTGLSQDVLRVWERRYRAVQPTRGPGGQRLYTDADVERLRMLHAATRVGRGISQVAGLQTDALAALVAEDSAARERRRSTASSAPNAADVVAAALSLAQSLDAAALDDLLRRAAARLGIGPFLEAVAAPLLRRLGDEWHSGRLTPAQEHLASSVLHDIALETMRSFAQHNAGAPLLVTTLAGERHVIGAALVATTAAVAGWNVIYLGGDLPAAEVAAAARSGGARVVAISIVYVEDRARVLDEMRLLRSLLPPTTALIAGGAGSRSIATDLAAIGVRVEATLDGWLSDVPRGEVA